MLNLLFEMDQIVRACIFGPSRGDIYDHVLNCNLGSLDETIRICNFGPFRRELNWIKVAFAEASQSRDTKLLQTLGQNLRPPIFLKPIQG